MEGGERVNGREGAGRGACSDVAICYVIFFLWLVTFDLYRSYVLSCFEVHGFPLGARRNIALDLRRITANYVNYELRLD